MIYISFLYCKYLYNVTFINFFLYLIMYIIVCKLQKKINKLKLKLKTLTLKELCVSERNEHFHILKLSFPSIFCRYFISESYMLRYNCNLHYTSMQFRLITCGMAL